MIFRIVLRAPIKQGLQSLAYPLQVLASSYLHFLVCFGLLLAVSFYHLGYKYSKIFYMTPQWIPAVVLGAIFSCPVGVTVENIRCLLYRLSSDKLS